MRNTIKIVEFCKTSLSTASIARFEKSVEADTIKLLENTAVAHIPEKYNEGNKLRSHSG